MFNDYSADPVTSVGPAAGAGLDVSELTTSEICAYSAGVLGAGVVGTGLLVATYVAPVPMVAGIGATLGLGIASTMVGADSDKADEKAPVAAAVPVQGPAEAPAAA